MFLFTLQLTDLRILNLEGNALSSIPVEALSGLRSLAELRLSGNPLKVVGADAFSELRSLTRLDLSGCQLRVRKLPFALLCIFNSGICAKLNKLLFRKCNFDNCRT